MNFLLTWWSWYHFYDPRDEKPKHGGPNGRGWSSGPSWVFLMVLLQGLRQQEVTPSEGPQGGLSQRLDHASVLEPVTLASLPGDGGGTGPAVSSAVPCSVLSVLASRFEQKMNSEKDQRPHGVRGHQGRPRAFCSLRSPVHRC